ncbi:MAG TPA: hypothetical protein VFX43_18330 [Chitinophagaceae bacterium]|jgi:hypothetical protein|nr:hypothetical protein [Chitinophagaceae bacterium]
MSLHLYNAELISWISFLIPLIPAWMFFRRLWFELKFFIAILTVSFIFSVVVYYTGKHDIHNLVIYFIWYMLEFYLYSILFQRLLHSRFSKNFTSVMMLLFAVLILVNLGHILEGVAFDSYLPAFLSLAMLLYCVLFFNQQLDNPRITFIYKTTWFWIITGLLLYFAGSFLIMLSTGYLMNKNIDFIMELWILQSLLGIVKNLLIAIGLVYIKQR